MKKHLTLSLAGLASLSLASLNLQAAPGVNFAKESTDGMAIIDSNAPASLKVPDVAGPEIWKDPTQPVEARVHDLISRMSLAEKASQLRADAIANPHLGIPAYSYRNECLHGVRSDAGVATTFPESIGMAATWDTALIHEEADVIATEGRAIFNDYRSKHDGNSWIHCGITFYSPNINIDRDPRWGRGQETYGEDPFLTGQFAVSYIRGLQGDDPKYYKTLACAKHYAVHSGPEPQRRNFNATPPERDLYETYLPAFEAAVREGHVGSVMGSYNALNGIPNCANPFLLKDVLRQRWGFQGYAVSDGGAIRNIWQFHKYVPTAEEAAAVAVKGGCDLYSSTVGGAPSANGAPRNWPPTSDFEALGLMLKKNLLSEDQIDAALTCTYTARFRLGMFDPPAMVPWSKITISDDDTPEHRALALKVAEESIVLLKNNGVLPLDRTKIKHIAVIGPNADATNMLLGNYQGKVSSAVTLLQGIKQAAGTDMEVTYVRGCPLAIRANNANAPTPESTGKAVAAAQAADVVIFVGGIDSSLEKEEGNVPFQGFDGGDRTQIELPPPQEDLLKALYATGKPMVFVNCSGSAMAVPWEAEHLPAIVQAWYPGEEGGRAVAEVLFGDVNPAARLPITFYRSTSDLPSFEDYSMSNRTYRYFGGKPLFAFGHGLSYTKFDYTKAKLNGKSFEDDDTLKLSFTVKNIGKRDGDEVAQVYFRHLDSSAPQPRLALCGFTRLHVARDGSAAATVEVPAKRFRYWDTAKQQYVVESGKYELLIGAASDDIRLHVPFAIERD
jgi:beta-glucosidase